MKICLVGSSGGHLAHLWLLKKLWENEERFWITFNKIDASSLLQDETKYWCHFPTNRNIINLFRNFILAIKILRKEKPDLIITTGAGAAIPFVLFGKLFRSKTVFIEVYDRITKPTLTGRILYRFSDIFIVQWPQLLKKYKKAKYIGTII